MAVVTNMQVVSRALVPEMEKKLCAVLDCTQLFLFLGRLGSCLTSVFNAVSGETELQVKIQDLTSEVVDLCDKSALAFRSFQSSAADALYQIKSCLSFFSEGFGEIALDSIEETLESAKCIEDKANYLSEEFKRVEHEVKGTLEERQNHKGIQRKMEPLQTDIDNITKNMKECQRNADLVEKDMVSLSRDINTICAEIQEREKKNLIRRVFSSNKVKIGKLETTLKQLNTKHEKKTQKKAGYIQQHDALKKEHTARSNEMKQIMGQSQSRTRFVTVTDKSLQTAIDDLREMVAILKKMSAFWAQVSMEFSGLRKNSCLQLQISRGIIMDVDRRKQLQESEAFKNSFAQYNARWHALHNVCFTYLNQMRLTQRDLYTSIRGYPTQRAVNEL